MHHEDQEKNGTFEVYGSVDLGFFVEFVVYQTNSDSAAGAGAIHALRIAEI